MMTVQSIDAKQKIVRFVNDNALEDHHERVFRESCIYRLALTYHTSA